MSFLKASEADQSEYMNNLVDTGQMARVVLLLFSNMYQYCCAMVQALRRSL